MEYIKQAFYYLRYPLFEISGNGFSILSLVMAVFIFWLTTKASRYSEKYMGKFLATHQIDVGVKNSIQTITRYIVLVFGVLIALDTVGVSLNSLAALGAVLMVGIGFGLQNIAQNFISGLIILFERPIKVGDLVKVGTTSGKVVQIMARSTLIHTRDDVAIIVPNSQFISEQVINESFSGHSIRYNVNVGVAYGSDVGKVREILLQIAKDHKEVLDSPLPDVLFNNFGDSSLDMQLRVWVNNNWEYLRILSDLRFEIDQAFRDQGVTIPFPQRDVHMIPQKGTQTHS